MNPLALEPEFIIRKSQPSPFFDLYFVLKKYTLEVLNKNRKFGPQQSPHSGENAHSYLSPTDIDFVQAHLMTTVANQTKHLEKNLFILSTIVSLAPFLGLLGTVWGILSTFSELQNHATSSGSGMVLGGISLALATTVLGLIDAIPALIGYNYLKNSVRDFQTDMEGFSNELLASVEMYYRKVDVS
jgi:biopolymer transport protein TolQ